MIELTILRDNREGKPWRFKNLPVSTKDVTLNTGDYTLAEFCEYDDELDTYHPEYAIERKTGPDLINSVGQNRERFKNEIKRASEWFSPLAVLIEDPRSTGRYQDDYFERTKMTRSQVFGTLDSWERHHNVTFRFTGNRTKAQQVAHDMLSSQLRARLVASE